MQKGVKPKCFMQVLNCQSLAPNEKEDTFDTRDRGASGFLFFPLLLSLDYELLKYMFILEVPPSSERCAMCKSEVLLSTLKNQSNFIIFG